MRGRRGQFYVVSALLISIILVSAVISTYTIIRGVSYDRPPKLLNVVEETNLSIRRILEFSVGYYNSILQATGNSSYAKEAALDYLYSGFVYITRLHPDWGLSFKVEEVVFSTEWFSPTSYSMGRVSVTYSSKDLGMYGLRYNTSCLLKAAILESPVTNQVKVQVTGEDGRPDLLLGAENFLCHYYSFSNMSWVKVHPSSEPRIFSNGTYILQVPFEVDRTPYMLEVADSRGIRVLASSMPSYTYQLNWASDLYSSLERDVIVVEVLQNGTMRWLGEGLEVSTQGFPIPPIPVKALRVNQTIDGVSREVPFQVEDWGSDYRVPLGLTSNASIFNERNILVFLVNHRVEKVTIWWDGRDTVNQTSFAVTNRYFTGDQPENGVLSNGILTLYIDSSGSSFKVVSVKGSVNCTVEFMRINNENSFYGADPAYVIHHGVVRDIIQEEAEWSGGVDGCPNLYSHIVLTLPANATYFTYSLRITFINSTQERTVTDLSLIKVTTNPSYNPVTENGTDNGLPIPSYEGASFYNYSTPTGWKHHWSEFISGMEGCGVMMRDNSNKELYVFDGIAGEAVGAIRVVNGSGVIEINLVSRLSASFQYPLTVTLHGLVMVFDDEPIYPSDGGSEGLWVLVEYPPTFSPS